MKIQFDNCDHCNGMIRKMEYIVDLPIYDRNLMFCSEECMHDWLDGKVIKFDIEKEIERELRRSRNE